MATQTEAPTELAAHINALVATLDSLLCGRPVVLFDWPEYPNAGDHFIWLGEKVILRHRLGVEVVYECELSRVDFRRLMNLPPQVVFVMQGGGNFGDLYSVHQRMREAIISAFPDRRIILMPQSITYRDPARQERSAHVLSQHPDLHTFARDQVSYETLTGPMGLSNCHLHIDSAFALQPIVTSLMESIAAQPERDALYLIRRDHESGGSYAEDFVTLDWNAQDSLAGLVDLGPSVQIIAIAGTVFDSTLDAISWGRLSAAVRLFGSARSIVTDRLHAHILALMMGKPVVLHDTAFGKNSAFCLTWTYRSPLVGFISPPPRLRAAISALTPDMGEKI